MDYIKIRFTNDFEELDSRFEKTIDDMFRSMNPIFAMPERSWKPPVDMYETSEEVIVVGEIAGVEKEKIEVEISTRSVKIYGKRVELPRLNNATYRLAEIQYGYFERVLHLPAPIDPEIVSASYTNGFLQIRLAKIPPHQPRTIPISDG